MLDRIRDAIYVLMGYQLEYPQDEEQPQEPLEVGPITEVPCAVNPEEDSIALRPLWHTPTHGNVVSIRLATADGDGFVILTPSSARAFAAGLLNAADEADGTTPLLFVRGASTAKLPPEEEK